jgi:NAD(P)-dependent dehydrogenase (short-subunit alcohol dehydrogenase family)
VAASGLFEVTGEERLSPLHATLLGPCGVIPREYPHVSCRVLDLLPPAAEDAVAQAAEQILTEASRQPAAPRVALRRGQRFVQAWEPLALDASAADAPPRLRSRGVCLITGGLGGIGLELAEHLARRSAARLVLVGRSAFPEREVWPTWLAAAAEDDAVGRKIRRLMAIEELGGEVLVLSADLAAAPSAAAVVAAAERRFGAVNGVIHAAGVPGGGLIQGRTRETARQVLAPKVDGAMALAAAVAGRPLDFFVVASSITAVLAQPGQVDYVAANAFLDAFALDLARRGVPAVAIGWDAWRETGMAVATEVPEELRAWRRQNLEQGLSSAEGVELFDRVVASGLPQVLISTLPFELKREENDRLGSLDDLENLERLVAEGDGARTAATAGGGAAHPRPPLASPYVAAATDLERRIAAVWQEVLGVQPVGLHDNFFELGGNSLAGLRVVQRLRERLDAGVSEVSLYEAPTVAALALLMGDVPKGEAAPPAFEASRGRGERRKAAMQRKRLAGDAR